MPGESVIDCRRREIKISKADEENRIHGLLVPVCELLGCINQPADMLIPEFIFRGASVVVLSSYIFLSITIMELIVYFVRVWIVSYTLKIQSNSTLSYNYRGGCQDRGISSLSVALHFYTHQFGDQVEASIPFALSLVMLLPTYLVDGILQQLYLRIYGKCLFCTVYFGAQH